ncbi:hypothetical protein SUDANB108_06136 [Streptomyces sp. enrichment culture]
MIGQHGTRTGSKGVPVRYEAIGGRWSRIEPLVEQRLVRHGIPVTVYDHGQ